VRLVPDWWLTPDKLYGTTYSAYTPIRGFVLITSYDWKNILHKSARLRPGDFRNIYLFDCQRINLPRLKINQKSVFGKLPIRSRRRFPFALHRTWQYLKQEGCLSVVLCVSGSPFSNLLNQFHGLMILQACLRFRWQPRKDAGVCELVACRGFLVCRLSGCGAQTGLVFKMFIITYRANYTTPRNKADSFDVNNTLAKSYR